MNRNDLREIGVLDGPAEPEFDRLLTLAVARIGAPVALMSIIDDHGDRQFFKSALGLPESLLSRRETPLSQSICRLVAAGGAPLIIRDAREDARLAGNAPVEHLDIVAYLGVPIEAADGDAIGALCAIEARPREWSQSDVDDLRIVAEAVSGQIRLRLALREADVARRAAETASAALEEANRRFRDLAANVPGAIFRYVAHADGGSHVEYMSPGCFDIWEIPAEEIVGDAAKLWSAVHPDDLADMAASVRWSAEHREPWRHRWRIRTPSGRVKWLQGYGQPQRLEDGATLWNSLILDVTVEVVAQQKLTENIRMLNDAQKQESIGRLAGGIAHDFNNLLSIVLGNAELLLEGLTNEDPETFLKEIKSAALRGGVLTRRLLSFARRSDLRPSVVDVNQTIAGLNNLLRRTLPENIAIETSLMAGLWRTRVDEGFLESSLLNLVVNARDAMPKGGLLTIETANMRITADYVGERMEDIPPGRYVMIAVTDTGDGIDPAQLPRVFEPFFTTKEPDKGTGLGLAMVQGFAKQSGGTIRVYSEPGRGAAFKIYLPIAENGDAARADGVRDELVGAHSGTVLLAEDQASVRRVARLTLESAGYDVIEAASGDQAFERYLEVEDSVDIVVTDVVMPGRLQGPELVAAVRRRRADMPVIYISGYPHEANVHGNGVRAEDVSLTKPLERETLLIAVRRALGASR